jgi:hypothetical protein
MHYLIRAAAAAAGLAPFVFETSWKLCTLYHDISVTILVGELIVVSLGDSASSSFATIDQRNYDF